VARDADDATFREWLHDQAHHHQPIGGADPYLRDLLTFRLFDLRAPDPSQSPMHQGWGLDRHLAASALELDTASAVASVDGALAPGDLRLAMRVAMLFHDTGKLAGPSAQRRHGVISARLFAKHRPAWFPRALVTLTRWMIETHDLFGAFGRGLTEKVGRPIGAYDFDVALPSSYFGALDSQAVRARLVDSRLPLPLATRVNKALWRADVGSIAALRWLLPVAELVERLVLCGSQRRRRGPRDRRSIGR